jgi:hypothetical protein
LPGTDPRSAASRQQFHPILANAKRRPTPIPEGPVFLMI